MTKASPARRWGQSHLPAPEAAWTQPTLGSDGRPSVLGVVVRGLDGLNSQVSYLIYF